MPENKEYFKIHKYRDPGDYVVGAYAMPKIKFMEESGCLRKNAKILDVGSGNGTFGFYFDRYTDDVVSVDNSEQLLRCNPSRLKVLADGCRMPFRDDQFDIVFEANLLHHLDRPYCAIEEMKRCSREYLVFVEPNRYNPLMFLFSLVVKAEKGVLGSYRKKWKEAARRLGLKIVAEKVTGMVSQQNTPAFMVPFLKIFDFDFCLGEYIILVCKK